MLLEATSFAELRTLVLLYVYVVWTTALVSMVARKFTRAQPVFNRAKGQIKLLFGKKENTGLQNTGLQKKKIY